MKDIPVNHDTVLEALRITKHILLPASRPKAYHDFVNVFSRCRDDIVRICDFDIKRSKVLVLGCGYTYPEVVLWSTIAKEVVGIDTRTAFWRSGAFTTYRASRLEDRSIVRALVQTLYTRRESHAYFKELEEVADGPLDVESQSVLSYDGQRLPFKDGSFQVVSSNAVLEHVRNLDPVCRETRRVTAKSGISYHLWHNYYSLSGAHVREKIEREHPWGHLVGDKSVDSHLRLSGTYLNKMLPSDIFSILSRYFMPVECHQVDKDHHKRDVDEEFAFEGEALLTNDLLRNLRPVDKETLLTRAYLFIGKKIG